jgi:hypothetical protein
MDSDIGSPRHHSVRTALPDRRGLYADSRNRGKSSPMAVPTLSGGAGSSAAENSRFLLPGCGLSWDRLPACRASVRSKVNTTGWKPIPRTSSQSPQNEVAWGTIAVWAVHAKPLSSPVSDRHERLWRIGFARNQGQRQSPDRLQHPSGVNGCRRRGVGRGHRGRCLHRGGRRRSRWQR